MTRRSILCSVLGLAGVPVVKPSVLTLAQKLEYSDIWDDRPASDFYRPEGCYGPVGPVGTPGLRGPSADGQNESEAEHAQRWADAEEWNRGWVET
jgi:hypothetical protein